MIALIRHSCQHHDIQNKNRKECDAIAPMRGGIEKRHGRVKRWERDDAGIGIGAHRSGAQQLDHFGLIRMLAG